MVEGKLIAAVQQETLRVWRGLSLLDKTQVCPTAEGVVLNWEELGTERPTRTVQRIEWVAQVASNCGAARQITCPRKKENRTQLGVNRGAVVQQIKVGSPETLPWESLTLRSFLATASETLSSTTPLLTQLDPLWNLRSDCQRGGGLGVGIADGTNVASKRKGTGSLLVAEAAAERTMGNATLHDDECLSTSRPLLPVWPGPLQKSDTDGLHPVLSQPMGRGQEETASMPTSKVETTALNQNWGQVQSPTAMTTVQLGLGSGVEGGGGKLKFALEGSLPKVASGEAALNGNDVDVAQLGVTVSGRGFSSPPPLVPPLDTSAGESVDQCLHIEEMERCTPLLKAAEWYSIQVPSLV